jgi:hypothetical protein
LPPGRIWSAQKPNWARSFRSKQGILGTYGARVATAARARETSAGMDFGGVDPVLGQRGDEGSLRRSFHTSAEWRRQWQAGVEVKDGNGQVREEAGGHVVLEEVVAGPRDGRAAQH